MKIQILSLNEPWCPHDAHLTGRALESLIALLIVLGISLVGLDPSISRTVFAAVLLFSAARSAVSPVRQTAAYRSSHVKPTASATRSGH